MRLLKSRTEHRSDYLAPPAGGPSRSAGT